MVKAEQPQGENQEAEEDSEIAAEEVVENATEEVVATGEIKEAVDPDNPKSSQKMKEFLKSSGQFALDLGRVGIVEIAKIFWNALKFVKHAVLKKGQVGFEAGYKIGIGPSSQQEKKDNK